MSLVIILGFGFCDSVLFFFSGCFAGLGRLGFGVKKGRCRSIERGEARYGSMSSSSSFWSSSSFEILEMVRSREGTERLRQGDAPASELLSLCCGDSVILRESMLVRLRFAGRGLSPLSLR